MRSRKILIVDDDAFIRRPLRYILDAEGYRTDTAVDGEECLSKVAEDLPDLIFLDIMMPGRDGFSVCSALKRDPLTARIPVVLLSAKGQEDDRSRGLDAGAADFMSKPYSPSELVRRVREIFSGERGEK